RAATNPPEVRMQRTSTLLVCGPRRIIWREIETGSCDAANAPGHEDSARAARAASIDPASFCIFGLQFRKFPAASKKIRPSKWLSQASRCSSAALSGFKVARRGVGICVILLYSRSHPAYNSFSNAESRENSMKNIVGGSGSGNLIERLHGAIEVEQNHFVRRPGAGGLLSLAQHPGCFTQQILVADGRDQTGFRLNRGGSSELVHYG